MKFVSRVSHAAEGTELVEGVLAARPDGGVGLPRFDLDQCGRVIFPLE
jgi:hypothetical protein